MKVAEETSATEAENPGDINCGLQSTETSEGLDLRKPLDRETVEALKQAWLERWLPEQGCGSG